MMLVSNEVTFFIRLKKIYTSFHCEAFYNFDCNDRTRFSLGSSL